jgi:hypothetical protein
VNELEVLRADNAQLRQAMHALTQIRNAELQQAKEFVQLLATLAARDPSRQLTVTAEEVEAAMAYCLFTVRLEKLTRDGDDQRDVRVVAVEAKPEDVVAVTAAIAKRRAKAARLLVVPGEPG